MKSLRLMLCAMPLMLTGCSTMSSVNWSAANPWNWFGSSTKVSEQGVGELTASTPLQEQAIADALDGDYRLRSGMKTANGNVVRFFEVMKGDNVAMVINGMDPAPSSPSSAPFWLQPAGALTGAGFGGRQPGISSDNGTGEIPVTRWRPGLCGLL